MTDTFVVTLIGGPPWGFRIKGGSETRESIYVSRVNGGGKAAQCGIREGDVVEAVNGNLLFTLSQTDVQQLIRTCGDSLTIQIVRDRSSRTSPIRRCHSTEKSSTVIAHVNSDEMSQSSNKAKDEVPSEIFITNDEMNVGKQNGDVISEEQSEGASLVNVTTAATNKYSNVGAPIGPTFKAQGAKSVWTPGQSSSDRESDIQSKSIKSSPVKLKNVMQMIDHGRSKLSYQEVVSDDCLYNKNSTLKEPTILSKSASATMAVIDKSAFKTVNPVSVTYNDKEIPEDAIVVDKRVSVKDDNVQTDTYYAVPTKEISKVKNVIKAPTYDGIGPMEDGVPIGLRTAIKKEHSGDWYKTMFKSLHKLDTPEGKKYAVDGYMSDPELTRKDRSKPVQNLKSSVLTNGTHPKSSDEMNRFSQYTFPAAKSSYKPYNHKPWIISDYEPGNSSISDVEAPYENKRHLPPLQSLKPKYVYNDGYDSDSTLVHKTGKVHKLDPQQQKLWYHEIQKGGDVPVHGLCKPAPLKPSEPVVGPAPVMPIDWDADYYYKVCSTARTETRPKKLSSIPLDKDQEKQKTHEDICLKLDEMLLSTHEANKRHLPNKSPVVNSQLALNGSSSPSTSPIQPFKVTVLYDFVAHTSRELPLRKGDIVTVQRQMDKNWYEGKYKDKIGIFPISYTEPASMKSSNKLTKKLISGQARVKFDFFAENRVELSMHKGDIVSLIREVDNNWYEGELNENKGIFPASYVEILSDQNEIIQASSPKLLNSPLRNGKNDDLFPMYRNSLPVTLAAETVTSDKNKYDTKSKFTTADYDSNKISPYKVLYAYKPQNDDELELQEGDVVYVVEICDDGWFVGTSMRTGLFGTFPGNYIEKI